MTQTYKLWFVNNAEAPGEVCVFQTASNFSACPDGASSLAWMVQDAHPQTVVKFAFKLDYNYVWFNGDNPVAQQIIDAPQPSQVAFTCDAYGYSFATPVVGSGEGFSIEQDGTVSSKDNAVVGIGMAGAGVLGLAPCPNIRLPFVPVAVDQLRYSITYGTYDIGVNDVLDLSILNPSGVIAYPDGVVEMTATLTNTNTWAIAIGPPADLSTVPATNIIR